MEVRCKKRLREMASSSFDDCPKTKKICRNNKVADVDKGK
jgi:hypothetical protein